MLSKICKFMEDNHAYVVTAQREMTRRIAVGPMNQGPGEDEKAAWLTEELQSLGLDVENIASPDPESPSGLRPNLLARVAGSTPETLWVIAHTDVVPPGDLSLWHSDPYELKVEGDTVIGRGVEDNQQPIASLLLLAKALTTLRITPRRSLGILLVADEETHSVHGLEYIARTRSEIFKPGDLVLIPDYSAKDGGTIEVAEKSALWIKITVQGRQCHASTPDEGVNSLVASSACVLALNRLNELYPQSDPLYTPPRSTFVPSKKEPNVENINTVPGLDVFYMDARIMPGINLDEVIRTAADLCEEAVAPYGAAVELEVVYRVDAPRPTSPNAAVVERLKEALKELRGIEASPMGMGGQTVAAVLRRQGIEAAAWSTAFGNPHVPNEKSSIRNTVEDAKVFAHMLF